MNLACFLRGLVSPRSLLSTTLGICIGSCAVPSVSAEESSIFKESDFLAQESKPRIDLEKRYSFSELSGRSTPVSKYRSAKGAGKMKYRYHRYGKKKIKTSKQTETTSQIDTRAQLSTREPIIVRPIPSK